MTQILEGDDDWVVGGLTISKDGLAPSIRGIGALVMMNSVVLGCQYFVLGRKNGAHRRKLTITAHNSET
jgi:hypothetical protein